LTTESDNSPQNAPDHTAVQPSEMFPPATQPAIAGAEPAEPRDPAWNGWDVLRLAVLIIVALFASMLMALAVAKRWVYPNLDFSDVARMPLVAVVGQAFGYLIVLGYMYVLVTRERHRPDFLAAIHWNFPFKPAAFLLGGVVLSVALQGLAHVLPIPKNLPIDKFFRTPAEAWVLTVFGVTLAPLMEELFFRAFLYPVLARRLGISAAAILTAFGFALLHGAQLMFAWGPVLVIFLVGLVLTIVREKRNSVAASLLIHIAYNGTISALMFVATDGFRHLEKLNNQ
jgi:membrane protease YdiL (CAAX protease family)